jgi:hypothetical protein
VVIFVTNGSGSNNDSIFSGLCDDETALYGKVNSGTVAEFTPELFAPDFSRVDSTAAKVNQTEVL